MGDRRLQPRLLAERMAAVGAHAGMYAAPGWSGPILVRRIPGAWLAAEGGRGLAQRKQVLAHLSAVVRL